MDKISEEKLAEYKESFSVFDRDGDGTISSVELKKFLESLGQKPTDKEVNAMIEAVDDNGNGLIDFNEFIQLMSMAGADKEEDAELKAAFKQFDVDGNGTISRAELKLTMKKLGDALTEEQIDQIIEEVDADGNGEIDYEEFVQMMKNNGFVGEGSGKDSGAKGDASPKKKNADKKPAAAAAATAAPASNGKAAETSAPAATTTTTAAPGSTENKGCCIIS